MIIGCCDLKLGLTGAMVHTLSYDVSAGTLEMSHRSIKGDVMWVSPHSASRHGVKTAQMTISNGALLLRSARSRRTAQVIGSMTLTALGATFCPEGFTSLLYVAKRDTHHNVD